MRKDEFLEIISQHIGAPRSGVLFLSMVFLPNMKDVPLSDVTPGRIFVVPYDQNFRISVSSHPDVHLPSAMGQRFILLQENFRSIPGLLEHMGYVISGFKAENHGRTVMDISQPGHAGKFWNLLKDDREIEFSEILFSRGEASVRIKRDMEIRISNPNAGIPELIVTLMEKAADQRALYQRISESLGSKRNDSEICLQEPITLPMTIGRFRGQPGNQGRLSITREYEHGIVVSAGSGVCEVMENGQDIAVLPDPSLTLVDVLHVVDVPGGWKDD
ncbi:MAG: hypothetical protein QXN26_01500 [Thermoplasmataceae archaeon]